MSKKEEKLSSITTAHGNAYIYEEKTGAIKSRMDKFGNLYDQYGKFVGHIDGGKIKREF